MTDHWFVPPREFREQARIQDADGYETAARDPEGYWAGRARELGDVTSLGDPSVLRHLQQNTAGRNGGSVS